MKRSMIAPLTISAAAAISLAATGPALAGPATTTPLRCLTWVSNSHPALNTTTEVKIRTAGGGQVFTVAHYTTGNRLRYENSTSKLGYVYIHYDVRDTKPGYEVVVNVTVVKNHQANSCTASFTPKP